MDKSRDLDAVAENAYDAFSYTNFSYAQTHIAHLFLLGRLFGLEPPDFRTARVLELGCGAGGNILPMADQYPEGRFVGIDLSQRQIEEGQALAAAIGAVNLELIAQSISDFEAPQKSFDYIICHGTFSWVGRDIQNKIMAIIREHLSPRGLAFVSYNTLPGWSGPAALRDMMLAHTGGRGDPVARIAQARRLLEVILAAQGDRASYFRTMVEDELEAMRTKNERYVFHEYLEDVNLPMYFGDFAAMAGAHELCYVCDADPGLGHLDNYAPAVRPFLSAIGDRLQREQYFDYLHNRRFRSSLLAHAGAAVRPPVADRIAPFFLSWDAKPDPPSVTGARQVPLPLVFVCANGLRLSLRERISAALAIALYDARGSWRSPSEIARAAKTRFQLAESEQELVRRLCEFVLPTYLSRGLAIRADPGRHIAIPSERPLALPLARVQALRTDRVTNALHEVVVLDDATQTLLPHLDGRTERADLAAIMAAKQEAARSGSSTAPAVELGRALEQLARNALLIG